MAIHVVNEIVIGRGRADVAAYVMDPTNDADWIRAMREMSVEGGGEVEVGEKMVRRASMMGRSIRYVYEVLEVERGRVLDMRSVEGPFAMETRYEFEDAGKARTRVRIRTRGGPVGFMQILDPLMGRLARRQVGKDLDRLKTILETR